MATAPTPPEEAQPGNVRELHNAVEYASVVASGDTATLADLPSQIQEPEEEKWGEEGGMGQRIRDALIQSGGTRGKAALGVSRVTLWKWMTRLGINEEQK